MRTPLRPLARILQARAEGANPDLIERENLNHRHQAMHEAYPQSQIDALIALLRGLLAQLPALDAGRYAIRVRAVDKDGLEGRDAVTALQIDDQPAPPYSIAPAAGSVVRTPEVVLRWTKAPGAAAYDYEVAGAAGLARPPRHDHVRGRMGGEWRRYETEHTARTQWSSRTIPRSPSSSSSI